MAIRIKSLDVLKKYQKQNTDQPTPPAIKKPRKPSSKKPAHFKGSWIERHPQGQGDYDCDLSNIYNPKQ